jgi:hypothetical protein
MGEEVSPLDFKNRSNQAFQIYETDKIQKTTILDTKSLSLSACVAPTDDDDDDDDGNR